MTHNDRVLARLRQGPATHLELYQLGVIAHSRISDLRRKGYRIEQAREGDLYIYRLLSEPDGFAAAPQAAGLSGSESSRPPHSVALSFAGTADARLLASLPSGLSATPAALPPKAGDAPPPAAGQLCLLTGSAVNPVNGGQLPGGSRSGTGRVRPRTVEAGDHFGVGGAHHGA